mmetsp:Transcript_30207/g.48777  ORF Transcript_30207/g.48777 Transcript_30207/m.48777 type:complete len:85 (+) Transcript_30207:726-980(+)
MIDLKDVSLDRRDALLLFAGAVGLALWSFSSAFVYCYETIKGDPWALLPLSIVLSVVVIFLPSAVKALFSELFQALKSQDESRK